MQQPKPIPLNDLIAKYAKTPKRAATHKPLVAGGYEAVKRAAGKR